MRILVSAAVTAVLASQARTACADAEVAWSAPAGCPDREAVENAIVARLPKDATLRMRGVVTKTGARYRLALEVETNGTRGERAIEDESCAALASSAAVVATMSFTPSMAPADPPPELPPPPPGAPPRPAPPPGPPPIEDEIEPVAPPLPWRFGARVHAIADGGMLPSAAAGGGLALALRVARPVQVEVDAGTFVGQDARVAGGAGASFSLVSFGARGCGVFVRRAAELTPCVGASVMRLAAEGFGARSVNEATSVSWGPEVTVGGGLRLFGAVWLRAGTTVVLPFSRQSFVIASAGTVFRPNPVVLRGWVGPEVRF